MNMPKSDNLTSFLQKTRRRLVARRSRRHLEAAGSSLADSRPLDALEHFLRADAVRPLPISALSDVVGILARAKRTDEAAPYARRLLQENPSSRRALRCLSQTSDLGEDILSGWRRLAETAPQEVEPWLQIARITSRRHEFHAAAEAAERVLSLAPEHSEAHHILGIVTSAANHNTAPALGWAKAHADRVDQRLTLIDAALRDGDTSTAAVLLGSGSLALDPALHQKRQQLRAILAADAFAAEANGNLAAAGELFWLLKEIALDEPDYSDGLNRCIGAFTSSTIAPPLDAPDGAQPNPEQTILDAVIEGRLDHTLQLAQLGQLEAAANQWREIQPIVRTTLAQERSAETRRSLGVICFDRFEEMRKAGDIVTAWEVADILTLVSDDGTRLATATASLLTQTLAMAMALPSSESQFIILLASRYLAQNDDLALNIRLAKALMHERRHGEALPIWESLAAKQPDNAEAWLQIARCARRLHRRDLGYAAAEQLLALENNHPEGRQLSAHFAQTTEER